MKAIFQIKPKPRYLLGCDFDGTLFNTSKTSPHGINVKKAYELALDDIFGVGAGKWILENIGLQNRTPSELISDVLNSNENRRNYLLSQAQAHYEFTGGSGYLIPEYKDGKLVWDDGNPETTVAQMLVERKLSHLMTEVGVRGNDGKMWPPPCKNALSFLHIAEKLKAEDYPVDLGIISSGHESFIRKTLGIYNVSFTGVLVTEDDIRPKKYPLGNKRRFKPGQHPLALAHYKWLRQQGLTPENGLFQKAIESKSRMMYIGDDLFKDVFMAKEGRVEPYLYTKLTFGILLNDLLKNKGLLDGRPIKEILTPNSRIIEACERSAVEEGAGFGYRARR